MDEHNRLYLDRIKNDLIEVVDSGTTEPQTTWALVENALTQLYILKDDELTETVKEYFNVQTAIKKKIKQGQKEQEKLAEEYAENVKNIYEEIKKL